MSLPGRLIDLDGIRVFVHRDGRSSGPPVVLLHGFMLSHWAWRRVIPGLVENGHDVVALDLPGFGESDRPTRREFRYDAGAYAALLVRLFDTLAVERAVLVGHSMGAGIALVAAAEHGERVERLVVVDPLAYTLEVRLEERLILAPIVGEAIFRTMLSRRSIQRFMRRSTYADPAVATDEWVDYVWERVCRPGGLEAAHAALDMVTDPRDIERSLRAVRAPTLIVWGEKDRIFPAHTARRLANEIPHAEVCIIPACGHSPPEERPEDLVRVVLPFLAGLGTRSATA